MIDAAQARNMRVIASTLTPRKDHFSEYQFYWDHLYDLSDGIIELAKSKKAAYIDPLTVFMNTHPPDGWKDLLESVDPPLAKGNHPNEEGHRIIAGLFAPALAAFPPLAPQNITVLPGANSVQKTVSWDANLESDLSHYRIGFDFTAQALNYTLTTAANHHTFSLFPFLPSLYFHIQAVDRGGNAGEFSPVMSDRGTVASPKRRAE